MCVFYFIYIFFAKMVYTEYSLQIVFPYLEIFGILFGIIFGYMFPCDSIFFNTLKKVMKYT